MLHNYNIVFLLIKTMKYNTFLAIISILLISCTKTDPVTGEKILLETKPSEKTKQFVEKEGGLLGNLGIGAGGKTGGSTNFDFASSNVLWRATLKTLDFLPIANVDYAGGIINYDWYSEDLNSREQIKITVRFLDTELRSESIQVNSHKRVCQSLDRCSVIKASDNFSKEIKDNIIQTARKIRIDEAKNKKN